MWNALTFSASWRDTKLCRCRGRNSVGRMPASQAGRRRFESGRPLFLMRIGILGSGLMGGKLGTIFARAGHEVVFSYSHSAKKLDDLARDAGTTASAGSPADAARNADAILLAVHWSRVDDVLRQAGDLSDQVVMTCSLPMNADDTDLVIAPTSSGAEDLAKRIPNARIVSAFGTVPSEVLFSVFQKRSRKNRPSLVYFGDD